MASLAGFSTRVAVGAFVSQAIASEIMIWLTLSISLAQHAPLASSAPGPIFCNPSDNILLPLPPNLLPQQLQAVLSRE